MQIDVRKRGAVSVLDISADSAGSGGQPTLHARLEQLFDAGESLFILELRRGPALDSALLGELITCREHMRKHGGLFKLVLTPQQREIVVASKLDSLFETFPDEESALDSFVPWYSTSGIP